MPDYDARLVELYDIDNPDGPDHDHVRSLADEIGAQSILDMGCGTGLLTTSLVRAGRRVVGIDPSTTMLTYAAGRPGGGEVTWVLGDSRNIPGGRFDLAVMSGNVAQHIRIPRGSGRCRTSAERSGPRACSCSRAATPAPGRGRRGRANRRPGTPTTARSGSGWPPTSSSRAASC